MIGCFYHYLRECMKKLNLYNIFLIISLIAASTVYSQDANRGKGLYKTCVQCHGDRGQGNPKEEAPRISGQFDWYIVSQLMAFKSGSRKNEKMMPYIKSLTSNDFSDLASYISSLK